MIKFNFNISKASQNHSKHGFCLPDSVVTNGKLFSHFIILIYTTASLNYLLATKILFVIFKFSHYFAMSLI